MDTDLVEIEAARYLSGALTSSELAESMAAVPYKTAYREQAECWALCSRPDTDRQGLERALTLVQGILAIAGGDWLTWYDQALVMLRLGRHAEVLEALAPDKPSTRRADIALGSASLRAIAHHHLGEEREARGWLTEARHIFDSMAGASPEAWESSSFLALLRDARALIE